MEAVEETPTALPPKDSFAPFIYLQSVNHQEGHSTLCTHQQDALEEHEKGLTSHQAALWKDAVAVWGYYK